MSRTTYHKGQLAELKKAALPAEGQLAGREEGKTPLFLIYNAKADAYKKTKGYLLCCIIIKGFYDYSVLYISVDLQAI